jgi:hypothetical protein
MQQERIDVVEFMESSPGPSDGDSGTSSPATRPPVRWRELCALLLFIVLADVTIFRGEGYAGYGVFIAAAAAALVLGTSARTGSAALRCVLPMLVLASAKLLWNGNDLAVATGAALIISVAMSLAAQRPFVLEGLLFASQVVPAGFLALGAYARSAVTTRSRARTPCDGSVTG